MRLAICLPILLFIWASSLCMKFFLNIQTARGNLIKFFDCMEYVNILYDYHLPAPFVDGFCDAKMDAYYRSSIFLFKWIACPCCYRLWCLNDCLPFGH